MALKRKRSCSNSSPASTSSFTTSTSRGSQSPTPAPRLFNGAMDLETPIPSNPVLSWNMDVGKLSSLDLNSRTRKRFRDNRPNENIIHETTMDKLFSAQRQFPHAAPILSQSQPPVRNSTPTQKSTLHSFWSLPRSRPQPIFAHANSSSVSNTQPPCCEDCDGALQGDGEMDIDYGDSSSTDQFECQSCGRSICGTCAVVGDNRNCLHCVTMGASTRRGW